MPDLLQMDAAKQQALIHYPKESRYVRWGMTASIGAHVLFALIVLILAWLNNIRSLRDLMTSAIAMSPPPNEIQVILPPDDIPPPPTDHPLFIKQIIQVPKPPPIPKPKPKPPPPKPQPIIQHLQSNAHPTGAASTKIQVGSSHFPRPDYPYAARSRHLVGNMVMTIVFNGSGKAVGATVAKSTGSSLLDNAAREKILDAWGDPAYADKTINVPIQFTLE